MGLCTNAILAMVLLAQAPPPAKSELGLHLSAPVVNGKPVEVAIGFYAFDFARVTSRDESFDLTGYLELSWRDPRLEMSAEQKAKTQAWRRVDGSKIWMPRVYFENALEQPRQHAEGVVEVTPDGVVTSWSICSGKFSTQMHLHHFPFDHQKLSVRIGAFDDESVMKFRVKNELVMVGEDAFLTDWTIGKPAARVGAHQFVPGQDSYSRYTYEVGVLRRSTFYIWRVMVPLTILALIPWSAFWFEPVGLQPQISTCLAALIALVTFNFAIDFSLPKLVYLTLIDRHALISFGFVTLSVAAVTLIHVQVTDNRLPLALSIQRIVRWIYLPAYILAVVVNLAPIIG
jgi:hypothetical protein